MTFASFFRTTPTGTSRLAWLFLGSIAAIGGPPARSSELTTFFENHCLDCHQGDDAEAGLNLQSILDRWVDRDATSNAPVRASDEAIERHDTFESIEAVHRRLMTRQMPPAGHPRPDEAEYLEAVATAAKWMNDRVEQMPRVATPTLRRLTRREYVAAIEDLFGIRLEPTRWLPADPLSHGFDNVTVDEMSPGHLQRFLATADAVSQMVLGRGDRGPAMFTHRVPADRSQHRHVDGLPWGTRGGTSMMIPAADAGRYEIAVRLTRDRDEKVEGLNGPESLDVLVDDRLVKRFSLDRPSDGDYTRVDASLRAPVHLEVGVHEVVVTFPASADPIAETQRQPFDAQFNRHRHPRKKPAVFQVTVTGPINDANDGTSSTDLPRIDRGPTHPLALAKTNETFFAELHRCMRLAYRRELVDADLETIRRVHDREIAAGESESAAQATALAAMLINPNFLLRRETGIATVTPHDATSAPEASVILTPQEWATRVSFFLWASLPDERLLDAADRAERAARSDPDLGGDWRGQWQTEQVRRMLDDSRMRRFADGFVTQWLYLDNLRSFTPDLRAHPDFDDNLRQSFAKETRSLFMDVLRRDARAIELIESSHTFLNERLAIHYDIPGVVGDRFRRVDLPADSRRGGLLRHGSVLTVTSYATRTSPTLRGNFVLENFVGTPPPPPPPDVPNLKDKPPLVALTLRDRLQQHRADPACASCHDRMDPIGFALQSFDAVGRYREHEREMPLDTEGILPNGAAADDVADVERYLIERPEIFAMAVAEKMMVYALGRGLSASDRHELRSMLRRTQPAGYRLSDLIEQIALGDAMQRIEPSDSLETSRTSDHQ